MATLSSPPARKFPRWSPAYPFILPYVLFLLAFGIGPAIYAGVISLLNETAPTQTFSGLTNYQHVFSDLRFGPALINVLTYLAIWLPTTLVSVTAVALLLHAHMGRFSATMRLIYYVPSAITGSASVLMWLFMIDPLVSPFSPLLKLFGLKTLVDVLVPSKLPLDLAVIAFFNTFGFWVVVLYGALVNISREVLEAATIDGCNPWQSSLYIKLPLVARYLIFMLILTFASGFQLFTEPQILGAVAASGVGKAWSLNQLAYSIAFDTGDFGASAALSMGMLLVGLLIGILVIAKTDFYRID